MTHHINVRSVQILFDGKCLEFQVIKELNGQIGEAKAQYERLMEQQTRIEEERNAAQMSKLLLKHRISKETHTLMHDEVLQFLKMAKMVLVK